MKTITANGMKFAVEDCGSGPPVLLVHGFPLDHTMWAAQVAALEPRFRVIAPDLRGFGGSAARPGTVTMEAFADDLAAILDALGVTEPVTFCGLSMGGYIALAFWRKYPQRVRRFVLADTRATGDTPEAAGGRLALAERVLAEGHQPLIEAMLLKLFWSLTPARRPEIVERVRAMFLAASPVGIAATLRGLACRPDCTALLPRIEVPALLLVGEDDGVTPPGVMRAMADAMPQAKYIEIPQAGHLAPLENAEAVNDAVLDWLG